MKAGHLMRWGRERVRQSKGVGYNKPVCHCPVEQVATVQTTQPQRRPPFLELHLPVEHDRGRHHNQVRPPVATAGWSIGGCGEHEPSISTVVGGGPPPGSPLPAAVEHVATSQPSPLAGQVGQQRNGLDGLAQPHLIGQDAYRRGGMERGLRQSDGRMQATAQSAINSFGV